MHNLGTDKVKHALPYIVTKQKPADDIVNAQLTAVNDSVPDDAVYPPQFPFHIKADKT
jgi:phosphoribosyl 1,2-cyclic phosphodiesterase